MLRTTSRCVSATTYLIDIICARCSKNQHRLKRGSEETPADLLNNPVLPFFEEHDVVLSRVLTDRGTEYCGTDAHEYELYGSGGYRPYAYQTQKSSDQRHL